MAVTPPDRVRSTSDAPPRIIADPVSVGRPSRPATGPDGRPLLTSFSSICPLRSDVDPDELQLLLERLPVRDHSPLNVPTTHYGRMQVIDSVTGRRRRRRLLRTPVLVVSADVDGTAEDWLRDVLAQEPDTFASVLGHCAGAPADPSADDFVGRACAYLLRYQVPPSLHFVNDEGRTVTEIRSALQRHRALGGFALGHRNDTPAQRRAAFLSQFGRPRSGGPTTNGGRSRSGSRPGVRP